MRGPLAILQHPLGGQLHRGRGEAGQAVGNLLQPQRRPAQTQSSAGTQAPCLARDVWPWPEAADSRPSG